MHSHAPDIKRPGLLAGLAALSLVAGLAASLGLAGLAVGMKFGPQIAAAKTPNSAASVKIR